MNQAVAQSRIENERGVSPHKARIVSLFAGGGGLEIAACKTGLVEAIVSSDSNPTFLSTIEQNMPRHFPNVRHACVVADARELDGRSLKTMVGSTPDLVMGGPPCDDYTQYGKRRGYAGDKGPLIFEFLRLVSELKPRCFIFENVPNLGKQFKDTFDVFLKRVEQIGYCSTWAAVRACDYGAPTLRTRIFVVGWRDHSLNNTFRFPEPTHADQELFSLLVQPDAQMKPFRFVSEVLDDIPDVNTTSAVEFRNHTGRNHRPATVEQFKTVPMGKKIDKSFRYRAPWHGLSQSLTAGRDDSTKAYLHPIFHREMTVREYARLHAFPDSWVFSGTVNNGVKQVANSVPIPLGEAILSAVIQHLFTTPVQLA